MRYRILRTLFLAIIVTFGLIACSEGGSSEQAAWYNRNTLYSYSGASGNLWDQMRKNMRLPLYTYTPAVRRQIAWYQHHQQYLNHVIAESAPYIYYIYQQTQQRHLPAELALIPVIESDYNPYSRSRVGAEGLWQMMPKTARGFGLKHDRWYNGSRDVVASTHAALQYFAYLHSLFKGNWLLAIASYDCGEGTVMAAIRYNQWHHHSADFWNLPLPNETRNYVPELLAVAAIVRNPGYYGIHLAPINDAPYIEQVNIGTKQMSLSKAAQLADVPVSTIKVLNPALQHDTTDPKGPYTLVLPTDKAETFREKFAALTENGKLILQQHYRNSKERLANMAEKYRTNVALLRQGKNNKNNTLAATTNVTSDTTTASGTANAITTASNNAVAQNLPINYEVLNGDTLHRIAEKFHTTEHSIRQANNLPSNTVKVGQVLTIPTTTSMIATATSTIKPLQNFYVVRKGDYFGKIAKHLNLSLADLKKWNPHISDRNLHPGQKLVIKDSENSIASND